MYARPWLVGLGVAVALFALIATPARASIQPPLIETFSFDETFPFAACSGFDVIRHVVTDLIVATFYNENGVPVELMLHFIEHNDFSNSVTGKSLSYAGILNFAIDLTDGTTRVAGAPVTVKLQGEGIVIQDTGLLIIDAAGNVIFEAGSHDFGPNGDPSVFCPLLQ